MSATLAIQSPQSLQWWSCAVPKELRNVGTASGSLSETTCREDNCMQGSEARETNDPSIEDPAGGPSDTVAECLMGKQMLSEEVF